MIETTRLFQIIRRHFQQWQSPGFLKPVDPWTPSLDRYRVQLPLTVEHVAALGKYDHISDRRFERYRDARQKL
jgi:hypothetical protein